MKETELRIGNLVFWYADGKKYETQVTAKDLADDTIYKNFEPIPLTEEILLKCGFKQEENISWYNHSCISISLNEQGSYVIFGNSGREITRKGIKYLHQLQNLYFALTGEELEINL